MGNSQQAASPWLLYLSVPASRFLPGIPVLTSLNNGPYDLRHTNPFSPNYFWSWCLSQQHEAQRDSVSDPDSCGTETSGTWWTPVESEPCISGKGSPRGPKRTHHSSQVQKTPKDPTRPAGFPQRINFQGCFPEAGCSSSVLWPQATSSPNFPTSQPWQLGPRHNWEAAGAGRGVQQLRLWTQYPCTS